jgi:hypothetical protein
MVPNNSEWFELVLKKTVKSSQILFGLKDAEKLKLRGPWVRGSQTKKFQLIQAGAYIKEVEEIIQRLGLRFAEAPWGEAFRPT